MCLQDYLRTALARGLLFHVVTGGAAALSDRCLKGMFLRSVSQISSLGLYLLHSQSALHACSFAHQNASCCHLAKNTVATKTSRVASTYIQTAKSNVACECGACVAGCRLCKLCLH